MAILFCQCIHRGFVDERELARLMAAVEQSSVRHWIVPDLCLLVEQADDRLAEIAAAENLVVLACSERAVQALFSCAGHALPSHVKFVNMRDTTVDAALEVCGLSAASADTPAKGTFTFMPDPGEWVPWYPVLEHDRCVKCAQCAEFCLFDVDDRGEEGVPLVARPRNCKDNCPACARICPVNAIVFPKAADPEVSGNMPPEDGIAKEQTGMSEILKKGVMAGLRQRREQQREQQSMVRSEVRRALEERARHQND
ncbi:MAG: 4Fe-4S dicluster domain-containing protein [bacterium]